MGGSPLKRLLINRILQIIPILFIISTIVFILVYFAGDPVTQMLPADATQEERQNLREALNLDDPIYVQYGKYIMNALQGDFGKSYRYKQDALPIVLERLPATIKLTVASMIFATIISIPLGIFSATKKNSILDIFATGGAVLGKAMPNFWLGIMLILLFSVTLQMFPVSGSGTIYHLILPMITLGTGVAADMTRIIRSNMLDIFSQDYIRTAIGKGVHQMAVVYKHAFRNSLIPVVTIMALQTSILIGGAVITETVFSWPGIGQLLIQAVNNHDMAVVQACIIVIALIVIIMNLLADFIYYFLDPRIRYK